MKTLSTRRVQQLLDTARHAKILVLGDVMLDQYIWGRVTRISPEAPVPILEFDHESLMPGGAANVARNLTALQVPTELLGVIGKDDSARKLLHLLDEQRVGCNGLIAQKTRHTCVKTRIIAHQQQVVRLDRETRGDIDDSLARRLIQLVENYTERLDAIIVGDYAKGVVTQPLLDALKDISRERGIWLSLDPKPSHALDLAGLSLLTPNRKEAFELAGERDGNRSLHPHEDSQLQRVACTLLDKLAPALLLITLGDQGMLLCQRHQPPFHIPTVAQEVFDVSGAGDTVIASFTLAIVAGASPVEAAIFSNYAAGVVVGKVGTATVTPQEILTSCGKKA